MRDGFVHLHVHSNFSMLDGACPIEALVEQAKRLGMEALALTDHDGLYGAIRFYQQAKRAGLKPIIGAELTVEGSTSDRAHHLDRRQGTSPCPTQEECRGARRVPAGIRADSRPPLQETAGDGTPALQGRQGATRPSHNSSSPLMGEDGGGGEFSVAQPPPAVAGGQARLALSPSNGAPVPHPPTLPRDGGRGIRGGASGEAYHLILLAKDRTGYSNLCRLITHAHLSRPRGEPRASIAALEECSEGLIALSGCKRGEVAANILDRLRQSAQAASHLAEIFGRENFFIELPADDPDLIAPLAHLARRLRIGTVATNNVHYISPEKAHIHDLLACIGALSTIHDPSPPRHSGGTAYFKSAQEMQARFIAYPEAIAHAVEIADRCGLDLGLGEFHFPHFPLPPGHTADSHLEELCRKGALERYGELPAKVLRRLRHELSVIRRLGFSEYFLVVWDIVRWARSRGIRCSGRGSAGDSLVSYLLGLTSVDPIEADLLFERFLNPERKEMPDVDLDFDSRRRDEVIDYVYQRFGKESVAAVATISTFNARSAIREAGRALGLPAPAVDAVSKAFPHIGADQIREAVSSLPELRGLGLDNRQLEYLFDVCQAIAGFPRHLSVHLGGMVIAPGPLADYLPVEMAAKGVAVAQFDKDDIEALGLVKMDLLGLRNLSAVQETIELLQERGIALDPDKIPLDDPETYRLLRSAQTVGVFQLESPGMRGLLRALQPTRFEDIIANISLFRPGPMQADMIGPFLARRHGKESVSYPHPATARALRSTYGVILYQEQVLEVASAVAGFTLGESDALRRAMTHDRSQEEMEKLRGTFLAGAARKGVDRETAQDVFRSLSAFAAYGFCKAHAACFGHISYQTAYLKAHHPAEFLAAILSNQPMGFYPPEVIVQEAKHLGIPVLPVDVNRSEARYTVEECFQPETTPFTPTLTLSLWDPEGSHRDPEGPHQGGGEAFCIRATVPAPSPQRGRGLGEEGDTQREESAGHPYDSGQQARLHVAPKLYPGASADRSQVLAISARANRTQPGAAVPHKTISAGDGCRAGVPTPATGGPGPFDFAQDRQARPTDGAGRKVLPYAMDVGAERCSARLGSSTAGGGCATWEQQRCSPTERDCRGDRPVAPTQAWRAIRVGLAQVQGISEAAINSILAARKHGPFTSLADFWARANVPRPVAENLIRCGALDSFGPKRALLWHLQALARSNGPGRQMRLFEEENPPLPFRPHTLREEAGLQLSMLGISLKCHPTYFCREQLLRLGVTPSARLSGRPHGSRVKVAGICIARMRPPTKSGQTVIFITLEDETGLSEVTVFERVYQKYGPVIFSNDALLVEGRLQTQGRYGITILAEKIAPLPL